MQLSIISRGPLGLAAVLAAVVAGCSSTGGAPTAVEVPARVRIASFTSGQSFEIVNETHTGRLELYSQSRSSAETKVQTDEVLDELLIYFGKAGFFEHSQDGLAPQSGGGTWTRSIEVDTPDKKAFMVIGAGSTPGEQEIFENCFVTFLNIYNATYQLQAVDQTPEWTIQSRPRN